MLSFSKLIVFCFLGVAFGMHRYVIDSKSCVREYQTLDGGGRDDTYLNHMPPRGQLRLLFSNIS